MEAQKFGQHEPDELTRRLVIAAYAQFCAQHTAQPSALMAKRFALQVTESGAREYHGMRGAALEHLLTDEFGDGGDRTPANT